MDRDELNNNSTSLYDSDSSEKSFASDYKPHVKYGKRKAARTKRSSYQSVSNELRAKLVRLVIEEGKKIKPTAKILGVNYSTAKSILQIYRKEGRVDKKLYAPGDENAMTSEMIVETHQKSEKKNEDVECEQRKADRRYPLRERKICEKKETLELPRPKHRSIEPKLQKLVKKMSVDTADQSLTSAESRNLEIKEEASKPVDNNEQTLFPKFFAAAQPIDAKLDENLKVIVGAPAENEVKKPFRSNVGFVAVKSTPKPIITDHKEAFSTQSLAPLIFNANNQINPIYFINLGLCGFFKFQN